MPTAAPHSPLGRRGRFVVSRAVLVLIALPSALSAACSPEVAPADEPLPEAATAPTAASPSQTTAVPSSPVTTGRPSRSSFAETAPDPVARWVPEIVDRIPHDPEAFTQGLVVDGAVVWESTGLYGESTLRRLDRTTGEVLDRVDLTRGLFGEGLELVGDRLIQLTWRERTALVWDAATLEQVTELPYGGEGWGICQGHTGAVVMSNGSSTLTFRDGDSFAQVGSVDVVLDGDPVDGLNELECVDGLVYANVFPTHEIVVVEEATGSVVGVIDAAALDAELVHVEGRDVLNGIAHDATSGTFLLTGKLWPVMFEVRFVEP